MSVQRLIPALLTSALLAAAGCAPVSPASQCEGTGDCPPGSHCDPDLKVCVGGEPDAGRLPSTDASSDSGSVDAGAADTVRLDGAPADSRTPDAVAADASTADGMVGDGAAGDATAVDAAPEDSAAADAAGADREPEDAPARDQEGADRERPDAQPRDVHGRDLSIQPRDAAEPLDGELLEDAGAGDAADAAVVDSGPVDAGPWVPSFPHRLKVIFKQHDPLANRPLADFPVLVRLTSGSVSHFDELGDSGEQLVFYDSSASGDDLIGPLPHEVDSWNPGVEGLVWVRVPSLVADGSDHIWLFYGETPDMASQPPSSDVWSSGYAGVWHFDGLDLADATDPAERLISSNTGVAAGVFGGGRDLPGAVQEECLGTDYGYSAPLSIDGDLTLSIWVNFHDIDTDFYANCFFAFFHQLGRDYFRYVFFLDGGTNELVSYWNHSNTPVWSVSAPEAWVMSGDWYHFAFTRNATDMQVRFFINGEEIGEPVDYSDNPTVSDDGMLMIGWVPVDYEAILTGVLDEPHVSNVVRPPEWFRASYLNGIGELVQLGSSATAVNP